MTNEPRGTEWKVGLFMLIGIGIIAIMAIKFGKLGAGLKKYNTIVAEFPNASGLLKGATVYLSGAKVGFTADSPELIDGKYAVRVDLRLRTDVKIPRGSTFIIGSSGFLGDAFVSINPPANPKPGDVLKNGDYVVGTRLQGIGDLVETGGDVMAELKKRLQELETPIKDVGEIAANLKTTTKGLDEVVTKAKGAADTVTETVNAAKAAILKTDGVVKKVDDAATDLKATLADIRRAAGMAGKAMESVRSLLASANSGKGALGLLLADKQTAENLKALIQNLREHGVLFYKNKAK